MIGKQNILNTFLELVRINGESGNENKIADYLVEKLNELNVECYKDNADNSFEGNSGNVIGFYKGTLCDLPPIIFSSHMDTIEPTEGIKTFVENDVVRTDGTTILGSDDRAGITAILESLRYIIRNKIPTPPIKIIFSVAEEIGMFGSSYYQDKDPKSAYGFVFDSSADPGKIITNAPSSNILKINVFGKTAHAAVNPEQGVNAIKIAGLAIAQIEVGRVSDDCTVHLGIISGGKAINIVPDNVTIDAEVRSFNEDELAQKVVEIKSAFDSACKKMGGSYSIEETKKYPSFVFANDHDIISLVSEAMRVVGLIPEPIKYIGGSDANQYNSKGIPTVNLGMGLKSVHSKQEHININDILVMSTTGVEIAKTAAKFLSSN